MPLHKFDQNDIFYNRIKTHPQINFIIYDTHIYYNNKPRDSGSFVDNAGMVPTGYINLYELNIDRKATNLIYPYVVKEGSLDAFKTVTAQEFAADWPAGGIIQGSYPMSASLSSDYYALDGPLNAAGQVYRPRISALRTALSASLVLSPAYSYSSSLGDKSTQEFRLVSIPSIFYGSSIQKGSVSCKFYVSGTLIGELRDNVHNGELKQVSSSTDGATTTDSGSVAGVVLYDEGFLILTGSWPLSPHTEDYYGGGADNPRWIDFSTTGSGIPSSSFALNFSGTNYVPTLTMLAQAPISNVNYSNNLTAIEYNAPLNVTASSGSSEYIEYPKKPIKNIVSGTWSDPEPAFKRTVYINYIGLYDEQRNLIGIAKMANPVRKRDTDDFTFKLKLDF